MQATPCLNDTTGYCIHNRIDNDAEASEVFHRAVAFLCNLRDFSFQSSMSWSSGTGNFSLGCTKTYNSAPLKIFGTITLSLSTGDYSASMMLSGGSSNQQIYYMIRTMRPGFSTLLPYIQLACEGYNPQWNQGMLLTSMYHTPHALAN